MGLFKFDVAGDFTDSKNAEGNNPVPGESGNPEAGAGAGAEAGRNPAPETRPESTDRPAPRAAEKDSFSAAMGQAVNIPVLEIPSPEKPKRGRKKKAENDGLKELTVNISAITQAGYSMAAKLLKSEVFEISEEEANTIAIPAAKIFDRLNMSESMNKYGDYTALILAVAVITIPRAIAYGETKPKRKAVIKLDRKAETPNTSNAQSNKSNSSDNPANYGGNTKAALDYGGTLY